MMFPEYPFKSHYFNINEYSRIHYLDEGEGDIIVMVHGNPTWSFFFRRIIKLLSKKYRVIAIDHIGCGLSDKPQDYKYTLENHITNLHNLLTHLEINKFSLIVHDWGGAIGFGVALKNLSGIKKIVVLNTAAFRSNRIPLRISLCRIPYMGTLLVRGMNGFAWPAIIMAVVKPLSKKISKAYLAPYNSWKNRVAVNAFVHDIPLKSTHVSYACLTNIDKKISQIKDLEIPMMICWGGKDFCFNDEFYNEWCRRFPDAEKHYFPNGGHYVLEDCKEEINKLLTVFFNIGKDE